MNFNNIENHYIATFTDLNGVITYASPAFCKITGYSNDELIGQKHSIIRHPDTPSMVFKLMWKNLLNDKEWKGILKNRKKNGEAYWVDSYIEPRYDENGIKTGYQSIRFDVTSEYKLAETNTNLLASVKKYEKLFDSIQSGVAIIDLKGNFIDVNSHLIELMETSKEELLKGNLFNIHSNSQKLLEMINDKKGLYFIDFNEEKECKTKSGKKIWIDVKYKYFTDDLIILTIKDISAHKELEKASTLLSKQSKDAAMGEMISMIAHQWRQPLTTIESILAKIKVKRELKMYNGNDLTLDSKKISSIISHLSKTIDFFRDYLKPKNGESKPFVEIYNGVKNIIEPLCTNSKVSLEFIKDEKYLYMVDERLDQVILNLYKNSLDAYLENKKEGKIITELIEKDENIILKISDFAGGIDNSIINKILDPYFSTKSKNGTGLGLYMCKNIVTELLNGKFYFENNENGITFFIELNKIKKEKK